MRDNGGLGPTNAACRFKDVAPAVGSSVGDVYRMQLDVIPEPASLMLLGLGAIAAIRRR